MGCWPESWFCPSVSLFFVHPHPIGLPLPALQVKEVSYMHSEGINAGEMKHGPLALVDDKLPIVVVSTMDSMHSKMAGVIQQVGKGPGQAPR